ncbi:cytochrome P450 2J2-like isoform 4-T5 [Anomaloglossus baeobatrachus]|uniref:cytochrome P450 2J2-like isoform X4 n=1 Tax=Anomaloglossus baeobatrachus TaxID=238106 RepID=UPI003F500F1A
MQARSETAEILDNTFVNLTRMGVIWILLGLLLGLFSIQFMKLLQAAALLPPGPTPLPFIGNLLTIKFQLHHRTVMKEVVPRHTKAEPVVALFHMKRSPSILLPTSSCIHIFIKTNKKKKKYGMLSEIYGNFMTIWVGQTPLIVLNGYEAVKECLINNSEQVSDRPISPYFKVYGEGRGIVVSSGHNWKLQRRLGLKILRNLGLGKKVLEWRINVEARHLVEEILCQKGSAADPNCCIMNAVTNVITAVNFGHNYSLKDDFFHHIIDSTNVVANFFGTHFGQAKDDPFSTIGEDNLIQVLMDLVVAGSETVTSTLRWGLLYMVIYQDVQVKVQNEIDAFVESIENLQYEDRLKMPYTNAVIHEVQRLSTVVPLGVPRQCTQDIKLNDYSIKKGTIIVANLASVNMDPKQWKFPDTFNPSNFLDDDEHFQANKAFLPFSAGHRICMGEQMARTKLFIFFTSLLKTFSFHLPQGVTEVNMSGIFGATFKPHPYQICALPR